MSDASRLGDEWVEVGVEEAAEDACCLLRTGFVDRLWTTWGEMVGLDERDDNACETAQSDGSPYYEAFVDGVQSEGEEWPDVPV
jgi:hypothetical protein